MVGNLVNINEVPASRTRSFDLRPKAPLESGIKIYCTMKIAFQAQASAHRHELALGACCKPLRGTWCNHPIER